MRVTNWPDVLADQIERARSKPFVWGSWDCCHFVTEVIIALTGTDHRTQFPSYTTEDEAYAIVAAHGGMQGLIEHALGPSKPAAFAGRGDVVMDDFTLGHQPAICLGASWAAPGIDGLVFQPMANVLAAWSI